MAAQLQGHDFETKLAKAVQEVKLILSKTAQPPSAVQHSYEDKFHLVERISLVALASQLNCLSTLGLRDEVLAKAKSWGGSVSLRLKSQERCSFLREETHDSEATKKMSVGWGHGLSNFLGLSKTVDTVTEYVWSFGVSWRLELLRGVGTDDADRLTLLEREASHELKTSSKVLPHPECNVAIRQEVDIGYLLQHLSDQQGPIFCIQRTPSCTPRRNEQVEELSRYFGHVATWAVRVGRYFQELAGKTGRSWEIEPLLHVALPVFTDEQEVAEVEGDLVLLPRQEPGLALSGEECNQLLAEESRRLAERRLALQEALGPEGVFAALEAYLGACVAHIHEVLLQWSDSMSYVEELLRQQLRQAIGKELTSADFEAYMRFHYRRLFLPAFQPTAFSYAIRRSERHSCEGLLSIEQGHQPVLSICTHGPAQRMSFALDASTAVHFTPEVRLHACLLHQFAEDGSSMSVVARARQFSCFVLLLGRLVSATSFQPSCALLVQNKDDLEIPLQVATIPTPKDFKDAIESLAPEQQRFCKAFREMQLESTLFALMVVQVKPQLEQLLKLPCDSLTKEIQVTQDLMTLFTTYQIPSDLLVAKGERPLEEVKEQVQKMKALIEAEKELEIDERQLELQLEAERLKQQEELRHRLMEKKGKKKKKYRDQMSKPRRALGCLAAEEKRSQEVGDMEKDFVSEDRPVSATAPQQISSDIAGRDYTCVPKQMDEQFELLDPENRLRPSILTPGTPWKRISQEKLLAPRRLEHWHADQQKRAQSSAFDLLDALTKSGALPLSHASLHLIVAATHCFEQTLMETVIQDNVNPIEKVERSSLIMASTVYQRPMQELLDPRFAHLHRELRPKEQS